MSAARPALASGVALALALGAACQSDVAPDAPALAPLSSSAVELAHDDPDLSAGTEVATPASPDAAASAASAAAAPALDPGDLAAEAAARADDPAAAEPSLDPMAAAGAAAESVAAAADPLVITLPRETVTTNFRTSPFYFTAAFDGSLRFSLWNRTMRYARAMRDKHGRMPHLTYFVNACFYTTKPGKSDVGKAMSRAEVLVRRALTQQAINEGHDIADHGMGHHDGRDWSKQQWLDELDRFHGVMNTALFAPIADSEGGFVFPRFTPLAGAAAGETGASCASDSDCTSKSCVSLDGRSGVCTQPCNIKKKCPSQMACGAPMFRDDTDICVPVPAFPIELDGKVLFTEKGEPNLKHPRLKPYRIIGFRAPYLAANDALYGALAERGYQYDTSQSAGPGPPFFVTPPGSDKRILELALILHPGALTIPMDYNYQRLKGTKERMLADYEAALIASYQRGREPWNVGHHFAMWEEGAYLEALEAIVDRVLGGCPDAAGTKRCEGGEVVSFRELDTRLRAR